MTMQEQLRVLIQRNCAKLVEQIVDVGRLLAQIEESGAVSEDLIAEAQGITHQMKGAAGSIGFGEMGAAATVLDENLKDLRKRAGAISPDQLQATRRLFVTLQSIGERTTPEMSTLYNADLSQLAR
ncbi:MAG TPA: Hpt domain-containing protein [Methyloceanibacter sp.]|nr:Hpt domain-containing protein [Methyloceanibacter sp.]